VYVAKGVPHHLIAFRAPDEPLTAAEFQKMAIAKANEITARGKMPILAGGTGLYIRMVVDNFSVPAVLPNRALRRRLEKRSAASLSAELKKKDPLYASKVPPQNRRFITRALEVIAATGKPFSELQKAGEPLFDTLQVGIRRPRNLMYERIDRRVDQQMRRGLLKEAKAMAKRYGWDLPAMSGLGHRQLGAFLQGQMTLQEAVERIKRDTRHYAKRQVTWFRRDLRIRWVKDEKQAFGLVKKFAK
jgi:tRNA dimethylallyltransferase